MTLWLQPILWEPLQEPSLLSRYREDLIQISTAAPRSQPVERILIYQRLSVIYWMVARREPTVEEVAHNLSTAIVEREALSTRFERYVLELCESLERGQNRLYPGLKTNGSQSFVSASVTGEENLSWRIVTSLEQGERRIESIFGSRVSSSFDFPAPSDDLVALRNRELSPCTQSWLLTLVLRAEPWGG